MTPCRKVALGEILTLDQIEVEVDPSIVYRTAGIYSFGKGVFEREPVLGTDTSYECLYQLRENQFIVSRLNGWEGAIDVVEEPLAGCHVSNEYPTFTIDERLADPRYLRWIARWPRFWEQLAPRGSMVRRKRVQISQLLETTIPLPSTDDQKMIAGRLDRIRLLRDGADARATRSRSLLDAFVVSATTRPDMTVEDKTRAGWRKFALFEVATPANDEVEVQSAATYDLAGVYSFGNGLFARATINGADTKYRTLRRIHSDQLVMSRLKAWEGALAIVPNALDGRCVSQEFPTFDLDTTQVNPGYFGSIVTNERFWRQLRPKGIGARRERVGTDRLLEQEISLPPIAEQTRIASLLDHVRAVVRKREDIEDRARALVPSALNEAFAELN